MLAIGQRGPAFALPGVDGQTHALGDLLEAHRAVVVIFSCNHCPYVQAWEDRMIAIQQAYREQGVALVAINSNDAAKYPDDDFDAMQRRAKEQGFNFLYLHDETQGVAKAYGATRTPHVYLLDGDGILRYRGAIDYNYERAESVVQPFLRNALDAVLAGRNVEVSTTEEKGCTIKWK